MFSNLLNVTGITGSTSHSADSLSRITPFRNGNTVVHVASDHFYDPRVSSLFIFTRRPASSDRIPPRECRPRVSSASVVCERRSKDPGEIEFEKLDDSFAVIAAVTSCLSNASTVPMRDRASDLKKTKRSFGYSRRRNRERLRRHEARYGDQESPTTFVYRSDVYSFRNSNWASLCEYIGI